MPRQANSATQNSPQSFAQDNAVDERSSTRGNVPTATKAANPHNHLGNSSNCRSIQRTRGFICPIVADQLPVSNRRVVAYAWPSAAAAALASGSSHTSATSTRMNEKAAAA